MYTQSSSKARVRKDTVGENRMKVLFEMYKECDLQSFREACKQTIDMSTGSKVTKERFHRELQKAVSKDKLLTTVTNYLLAGQGLGV